MRELPRLPAHIRPLLNADSERLNADKSVSKSLVDCRICGGARSFLWYGDKTRSSVEQWRCPCEDQWILYRYLLNRGIGVSYQRLDWADFVQPQPSVVETVNKFNRSWQKYLRAGMGLVFTGPMGNGKSLLMNLLLKKYIAQQIDGYIVTFQELINYFTAGWHSDEDRAWFQQRLRGAGLLVVDDLGRERRPAFEAGVKDAHRLAEPLLDDVLRYRLSMELPTFVTSNLELDEIPKLYGPNIGSLFEERSITCRFDNADFRAHSQSRTDAEVVAGLSRPITL